MNNATRLCDLSGLSAMPKKKDKKERLTMIQIKMVYFFSNFFSFIFGQAQRPERPET
jgi:hypothetical protein